MKKKILKNHWVTKEFGLEVFIQPDEISRFIYVKTDNGMIHRFHKYFENESNFSDKEKEMTRNVIKTLNERTYKELSSFCSFLISKIFNLTQSYYINNGNLPIEEIKEIESIIKNYYELFKRPY